MGTVTIMQWLLPIGFIAIGFALGWLMPRKDWAIGYAQGFATGFARLEQPGGFVPLGPGMRYDAPITPGAGESMEQATGIDKPTPADDAATDSYLAGIRHGMTDEQATEYSEAIRAGTAYNLFTVDEQAKLKRGEVIDYDGAKIPKTSTARNAAVEGLAETSYFKTPKPKTSDVEPWQRLGFPDTLEHISNFAGQKDDKPHLRYRCGECGVTAGRRELLPHRIGCYRGREGHPPVAMSDGTIRTSMVEPYPAQWPREG